MTRFDHGGIGRNRVGLLDLAVVLIGAVFMLGIGWMAHDVWGADLQAANRAAVTPLPQPPEKPSVRHLEEKTYATLKTLTEEWEQAHTCSADDYTRPLP